MYEDLAKFKNYKKKPSKKRTMELNIISDDSCDADIKVMKKQLMDFGLEEENLSKEEMSDLLKALNNSKSTEKDDDLLKPRKSEPASSSTSEPVSPKPLKRHYKNVKDRRMPWSILPPDITDAEKARVLSVYIKLMSIKRYWQARKIPSFVAWPPPISIVEESTSRIHSLRSTRSGRNVPVYSELVDDDSSDIDFVVTKPKKRKVSGDDHADGIYTNKVVSLKRKQSRDEGNRPAKESKVNKDSSIVSVQSSTSTSVRTRLDKIFSMIND